MSEHTPGPWETSKDAVPVGITQITVYEESSGQRVATAFQNEANARLIAAAPELLEVLRMICDAGIALADPIESAMLAAIAKAEWREI